MVQSLLFRIACMAFTILCGARLSFSPPYNISQCGRPYCTNSMTDARILLFMACPSIQANRSPVWILTLLLSYQILSVCIHIGEVLGIPVYFQILFSQYIFISPISLGFSLHYEYPQIPSDNTHCLLSQQRII